MTARTSKTRFIALGMGGHGRITRLLGPFIGSAMVYACLASEKRTAEGQPRVGEISGMWSAVGRRKRIGPSTGLYGLIGHPLGHSLSPLMHNAAFRKLGMDAVYLPFDVEEEYLEGTILALKASGLRGANVTIPYKERIIPHLDRLDETARKTGAVNTIKNDKGMLTGFNTDVFGLIDALRASGARLGGARVLVMGAGGAAKAAVRGLLNEGASVTVANRTRGRALALRRALGARNVDVLDQNDLERAKMVADIIVNCTPLGMRNFPDVCPVPEALLRRCSVVFDMVYNPVRTPLLASAEKMGARTVSGMEMFIRQGMESFRIWTGKRAPEATIRRALAYSQKR
jgi:shikimate dehydrogenase